MKLIAKWSALCGLAFKVHVYVCECFPLIIKAFSFSTQYGENNMAYTALDKRGINMNMPAHEKKGTYPTGEQQSLWRA